MFDNLYCFLEQRNQKSKDQSKEPQTIENFGDFVWSLLKKCGDPPVMPGFQKILKDIDDKYTQDVTDVITDVSTTLKTSVASTDQSDPQITIDCMARFANCFIELDDSVTKSGAKCDKEDPPSNPDSYDRNIDTNRLTFTFFVQVELLLAPKCTDNSNTCLLNDNDDKKTLIRYIQKIFFNNVDKPVKIPFNKNEPLCTDLFNEIQSAAFLEYELQKQMDDLRKIRATCIDQIGEDYTKIMTKKPQFLTECVEDSVKPICYDGKIFLHVDILNLYNNIFLV